MMRDQYATDISDYLKFAFLRAVSQHDHHLGIAWYYIPGHDGRLDGRHVEYRSEPAWRVLDEQLYDQLAALADPRVEALEHLTIWPARTVFHRDPVLARTRAGWVEGMVRAMANADFVFLDPDNGLGSGTRKHARISDILALRCKNRIVTIIKFPGRHKSHQDQILDLHRELIHSGFHKPLTLITCVHVAHGKNAWVPRHRFFTIARGNEKIRARVLDFARRLNELDKVTRVSATSVG
jgi:hypothetical protein